MADALVFGQPNSLASKLADGLSDVLRVPVRYRRERDELATPGVAVCTTADAFTADAPIIVFADDVLLDARSPDPDRASALGTCAEAIALGRRVAVIPDKHAAKRWLAMLKADGLNAPAALRTMYIVGESGSGKTTLAVQLGEAYGLEVSHLDDIFFADPGAGHEKWRERIEQLAGGDRWIIEGVYWRAAGVLAPAADVTVYLDLPAELARERRTERPPLAPPRGLSLKYRAMHRVWVNTYPLFESRLLRRELMEHAAERPILRVRNEAEGEAVTRGLLRGAAVVADEAG